VGRRGPRRTVREPIPGCAGPHGALFPLGVLQPLAFGAIVLQVFIDMDTATKNRRAARRFPPRGKVKVTCHRGSSDLGASLAIGLLDVSESGARLLVRTALERDQEVSLTLEGMGHLRPLKITGRIVWCLPTATGQFCVGTRFDKFLPYRELTKIV
jgi:hypothetical protein